jgi:hypothetical protein
MIVTSHDNILLKETLSQPENGVIRTLLYFDIFHYPLTLQEILNFHPLKGDRETILRALAILRNKMIVFKHENFYSLHPNVDQIIRRKSGNALAQKRLHTAKMFSCLIAKFPFVRAIMLSGSLSKEYMDQHSDIDYFIITEPGKLWLTRALLAIFKRVFLLNSHKYFCTNYLIDSASLEIEEKNIYTAVETVTLIPVYGKDLCEEFIRKNGWTKQHLPNLESHRTAYIDERKTHPVKKILEKLFMGTWCEKLDGWFMKIAVKRWTTKFSKSFEQADFNIAFKSRRNVSKNHPQFFQKKILIDFQEKIERFEALNKMKISI